MTQQQTKEDSSQNSTPKKTRYYWCPECGYHGDFGKLRSRGIKCSECHYEDVTPLDSDEWNEYHKEKKKINDWLDGKIKEWK